MLTIEVAKRLGVTRSAVLAHLERGRLRGTKDRFGRWRISEAAFQRWVRGDGVRCPRCNRPYYAKVRV